MCLCIHTYIHKHIHIYIHTDKSTSIYVHAHMSTYICMCFCVCIYITHRYTCSALCYVRVYISPYSCAHVTCMHAHTYICVFLVASCAHPVRVSVYPHVCMYTPITSGHANLSNVHACIYACMNTHTYMHGFQMFCAASCAHMEGTM